MMIPDSIDEDDMPPSAKPYAEFYNETMANLDELSPEAQREVRSLLARLLEAIRNRDWALAEDIMSKIQKIFEEEGEEPPAFRGGEDDDRGGLDLQRDADGNWVYIDPVTGQITKFSPDLTQPGIYREYSGGEGAALLKEQKQFLERAGGDTFRLVKGETIEWDFQIQEDQNEVDFLDDGMKSMLLIRDQNGNGGYRITGWKVTNIATGAVIATATSGTELPLVFTESGDYRAEVSGETEWGSPFRIEAILAISF
jgi:hypothetical protein